MSWYNTPLKYMTEAQRVEAAAFLKQLYNRGAKR
jgi:hypothetical protein